MATQGTSVPSVKVDDVSKEIAAEPWSLYWKEFKSGTPEFEEFLHEPAKHVAQNISGGSDWNVSTYVVNHEIGFTKNYRLHSRNGHP